MGVVGWEVYAAVAWDVPASRFGGAALRPHLVLEDERLGRAPEVIDPAAREEGIGGLERARGAGHALCVVGPVALAQYDRGVLPYGHVEQRRLRADRSA